MGSRINKNDDGSNPAAQNSAGKSAGGFNRHSIAGIEPKLLMDWFSRLQFRFYSAGAPILAFNSANGSSGRVMRIDALESRELFAVLSGLVFEDLDRNGLYDPATDVPAIQQLVFLDQNGNFLFDAGEASVLSDQSGVAEFRLDFGSSGTILPVPRLQDQLSTPVTGSDPTRSTIVLAGFAPLSVAAFDTVFRGDEVFNPQARLAGGLSEWLVLPSFGEGEDDLDNSGITVQTTPLPENQTTATEVGAIFLNGETPPDSWLWFVSDPRFEVIGNKIVSKADNPVDHEQEPEIVMVVEGVDTDVVGPASSSSQRTTVTLTVSDQNDSPSGIYLSGGTVLERLAGATVGPVRVIDQDLNESYEMFVSDQRFEIVGSVLKLRSDIALIFDLEPYVDLTISARSLSQPSELIESFARIEVLPNPTPWTNITSPLDVNGDEIINAIDALIIINHLNNNGGPQALPGIATSRTTRGTPDYIDVNGDGNISAIDALIVINRIRRSSATIDSDRDGSIGISREE